MSYDTMASHDEGLEEAKAIVRKYLLPNGDCGEENCRVCEYAKEKKRLILAALTRAKENR